MREKDGHQSRLCARWGIQCELDVLQAIFDSIGAIFGGVKE